MSFPSSSAIASRYTVLDVFRGLTVCFMIIVNSPGYQATTFWPLLHAHWNGFTPTDLVFPSFLFAVGTALSFVMKRWETMKQSKVLIIILKRTAFIFGIGYLMYWFPFFKLNAQSHLILSPISQTRIMGVLQRIALCYGIVALMVYYLGYKKTLSLGVFFLLAYWAILAFFGYPGAEYTMKGNAVLRLDTWLFGANHLLKQAGGFPFDSEGVLSSLPSLFNVIGGYIVGRFIQQKGKSYDGLVKLLLAGITLLFIAYFWNREFPINKNIWTSSYAVLTVGLDCLILGAIIYVMDFLGKAKGSYFFLVFGRNALILYLMSELGITILWTVLIGGKPLHLWLFLYVFSYAGDYIGSLLFALCWMLTCWLVGFLLDKKKIYIKL
jgi:predicted acyltransferase